MSSPSAEAPSSGSFSSSPSAPPPAAAAAAACSSSGALVVFQVNGLVLTLSPLAKAVKGGGGGGGCATTVTACGDEMSGAWVCQSSNRNKRVKGRDIGGVRGWAGGHLCAS